MHTMYIPMDVNGFRNQLVSGRHHLVLDGLSDQLFKQVCMMGLWLTLVDLANMVKRSKKYNCRLWCLFC